MQNPSYLLKRGNTYYFRQVVPSDLISCLDTREIKKSLATHNRKEAINRAMRLSSLLDDLFRRVRFGDMRFDELKPELERAYHELLGIQAKYIGRMGAKSTTRRNMLEAASKEFRQLSEHLREGNVEAYHAFLKDSEQKEFIESRLKRRLRKIGHDGSLDSKGGIRVVAELTNMLSKFYEDTVKMHQGALEYNSNVTPAYIDEVTSGSSPKLSDAIKEFSSEKMRAGLWTPKTVTQNAAQFRQLTEIVGDQHINTITHEDAKNFKNVICNLPPHVTKNRENKFNGKTLSEIAKLEHGKLNTPKTNNSYIQTASSLFVWASDQGYCEQDYFKRLKVALPKKKASEERDAFSLNDLKQIEAKVQEESDQWKKWIVLIGIYSGMRLNEICQLYLDDIRVEEDILCFKLTENREDQFLKNLNSERLVPVHMKLVEYGLMDYIALLKRQRSERLFPKLKYSETNRYSHQATKWFSRTFMKKLTLEGNKSYHSFRHSMATELQRADVEETMISALLGHAPQSITLARYGKGYAEQQLSDALNKYKL